MMPKPGDRILFLPSLAHWHDKDAAGEWVFGFVYAADAPPRPFGQQHERKRQGDPVTETFGLGESAHALELGYVERYAADGVLHLSKFAAIQATRPKAAWPGVVRQEDVKEPREMVYNHADSIHATGEKVTVAVTVGRCLVLDVEHPNGHVTLHFPLTGPGAVPHDPTGQQLYSYRLAEEVTS